MSNHDKRRGISRRELLKRGAVGGAAVVGAGSLSGSALAAGSRSGRKEAVTIRVLTLGVEWPQGAQKQAEKDLGIKFVITPVGSVEQTQKALTAPETFDIFAGYHQQTLQVFPTGNLQPVDTTKLKHWNELYPLFSKGKLDPNSKVCTYGDGSAPFRLLYTDSTGKYKPPASISTAANNKAKTKIVQWIDESTGKPLDGLSEPTSVVGPPAHFNMDSMGYNADVIQLPPEKVGWEQLLNPKWKGKVSILNDPTIGMIDAGNAASALGLMKFKHLGNMTKGEIDTLTKILEKYKKQGQFRAFWSTFNESVTLMASKEVVIESMWSPAVALLVAQGVNVRFAAPRQGFRGWCSANGISAKTTDPAKLDACYAYLNWMHDGYLGASIMRQGYYIANGKNLKSWIASEKGQAAGFTPDEYAFWYEGKPAATDLTGITGQKGDIKKGSVRDGGSFVKRACKYTAWNSFMVENEFQTTRWNDFLAS